MNIGICVATYKRPEGLRTLLDSFAKMHLPENATIRIFVADNDPELHEGFSLIETVGTNYPFIIHCEIERGVGISHARNKSLSMVEKSKDKMDYIAFTDDDMDVSPQWINDLINAAKLYSADVVFGKTEPRFPHDVTTDILQSPYFLAEGKSPATGSKMINGGTGNVLFRSSVFEKECWSIFDANLSLSGSEDKDLFMALDKKGYKMVFCASAVAYEPYSSERLKQDWFIMRYKRRGSTQAYLTMKHDGPKKYYSSAIKIALRLPLQFIRTKISPSPMRECYLAFSIAFLNYVLKRDLSKEYERKTPSYHAH